jgi:hypothetical protein
MISTRLARYVELGECLLFGLFALFVTLAWPLTQKRFERSWAKSEFLCHEQGSWGRWSEEARRTAMAEARLARAQQWVVDLNGEMVGL